MEALHRKNQSVLALSAASEIKDSDRGPKAHALFPPEIQLYDYEELLKLEAMANLAKDAPDVSAMQALMKSMASRGQMRTLMTMSSSYRTELQTLRSRFPNFSQVIDYIRGCAEIAARTDNVLRFTPILLNGAGGIGKTMFSEALALWMNQGLHRISVSSSQNGSDLSGSSSFFSNAKPGVPFTSLVYSDTANQLILLDEVDKNTTGSYDALGALYVLLEPSTAKTYKDQCYPIPIDASHLLYIACSNDVFQVPEPLRTRFKVFDITITFEQARAVALSIIEATLAELSPATDEIHFSESAVETLASMAPRRVRQAVIEAIGQAFADNVVLIESIQLAEPSKRRIGFLP